MTTYHLILGVWWGPNQIERRSYVVQAESWGEALWVATRWALTRRAGGAKAKNVTSYKFLKGLT